MAIAEESEFKGNPVLSLQLKKDSRYGGITFGVKKAQLILEHIKDIEAFVEKHAEDNESKPSLEASPVGNGGAATVDLLEQHQAKCKAHRKEKMRHDGIGITTVGVVMPQNVRRARKRAEKIHGEHS